MLQKLKGILFCVIIGFMIIFVDDIIFSKFVYQTYHLIIQCFEYAMVIVNVVANSKTKIVMQAILVSSFLSSSSPMYSQEPPKVVVIKKTLFPNDHLK